MPMAVWPGSFTRQKAAARQRVALQSTALALVQSLTELICHPTPRQKRSFRAWLGTISGTKADYWADKTSLFGKHDLLRGSSDVLKSVRHEQIHRP
jgi:hypothetical protein